MLSEPGAEYWSPPALQSALEALESVDADGVGAGTPPPYLLVLGGAGMGKSSALALLAERAEHRGLGVVRGATSAPAPHEGGPRVRLVDDAHELDEGTVTELGDEVGIGRILVLAARSWPQSESLGNLMGRLRGHGVVMLGPWEPHDVEDYLRSRGTVGVDCSSDQAGRLLRLSGGLPWLVAGLAAAGPESGHPDIVGLVQERFRRLSISGQALVQELAVGFGDDDCPLADQLTPESFDDVLYEVDAAGLLGATGELPPVVARVVVEDLPLHRRRRLQRQAVSGLPEPAQGHARRYERVALTGARDERLAHGLLRLGDDALTVDPDAGSIWYDRAEQAGAAPELLHARRAEAALRTGDPESAARLVDAALAGAPPAEERRAARVALAVSGQSGGTLRAAEISRWLGPAPSGPDTAVAMVVLLGQGRADEAARFASSHRPGDALPTRAEEIAALVISGLQGVLRASPTDALPDLVQAAQASIGCDDVMLPLPPAALAALASLHAGELGLSELVLGRALDRLGPQSRWYRWLSLLAAWTCVTVGDLPAARQRRVEADAATWPETSRDAFWGVALDVALARRGDDAHALARAWSGAAGRLMSHPVDLYDLLPLGELHVAAVRVHDSAAVDPQLRSAWAILSELGSPPLWETSLHWDAIQGAILANRPQDIPAHAQALVRASETLPYAAVLASVGRVWMQVLAEDFAVQDVLTAAQRLRDAGQVWQACRLLGHAAARAAERKDAARLLESAREMGEPSGEGRSRSGAGTVDLPAGRFHLSEREIQVARLVIDGLTYREVGLRLYLSDRTVEHHMARIRQRVGANSRGELLDQLREVLGGAPAEE